MDFTSPGALREQMDRVAEFMLVDFKRSAPVQHRASKGTVREGDLRRSFLEKYVSGGARVMGSGELIATDGQVSNQCDIMIADRDTPPLWRTDDYAVVPIECCQVVIEVKSNLTAEELRKSWAAAKRAKSMPRTAYAPHPFITYTRSVHGRIWDHAVPLRHILFAYDSATLERLAELLSTLASEENDPAIGIDALCVLNRGIVSWHNLRSGSMFERMPESYAFAAETEPGNVLLFMLTCINEIVAGASLNDRVDMRAYLRQPLGEIQSWWKDGARATIINASSIGGA